VVERLQESTMVVVTFKQVIAESEDQLKMHVEIASEHESADAAETPVKAVVYWLNPYTGYFMAPSTITLWIIIRRYSHVGFVNVYCVGA